MKRIAALAVVLCLSPICLADEPATVKGSWNTPPTDKAATPQVIVVPPAVPPNVATTTEVQKATDDTKKAIEDSKKIPPAEDTLYNAIKTIVIFLVVLAGNWIQARYFKGLPPVQPTDAAVQAAASQAASLIQHAVYQKYTPQQIAAMEAELIKLREIVAKK